MESPITIAEEENNTLYQKPPKNITFWEEDEKIGELSWENGTFAFEGDCEKSAEKFFAFLNQFLE